MKIIEFTQKGISIKMHEDQYIILLVIQGINSPFLLEVYIFLEQFCIFHHQELVMQLEHWKE